MNTVYLGLRGFRSHKTVVQLFYISVSVAWIKQVPRGAIPSVFPPKLPSFKSLGNLMKAVQLHEHQEQAEKSMKLQANIQNFARAQISIPSIQVKILCQFLQNLFFFTPKFHITFAQVQSSALDIHLNAGHFPFLQLQSFNSFVQPQRNKQACLQKSYSSMFCRLN